MHKNTEQGGFTLLETICVASIMFMLSAMFVGFGSHRIDEIEFEALIGEVFFNVTQARLLAHDIRGRVEISAANNVLIFKKNLIRYKSIEMPENVQVYVGNKAMTSSGEIVWNGDVSASSAGTITLTNLDTKEQVQITVAVSTGKVTLYE